jgi:large subunit ribosomal protein L29
MANASDLAQLDGDELATRLGDARRELFNLRFQLATGQLDNPARVGQVRHDVARILTVLRAREILEAEGAYVAPTAAEHEDALAKLAAEDAAVAEKAAARAAAAEAEAAGHDHAGHTHDDEDDDAVDAEFDDEIDDEDEDDELEEEEA